MYVYEIFPKYTWDIYVFITGKLCISLASLKSHMRKHIQPAASHYDINMIQSDRQFPISGKICRNLVGLKSHPWVYTTPQKMEERERNHKTQ